MWDVRAAAERYWRPGAPPTTGPLTITIGYFYEYSPLDVDNVVKPILDALIGLVYEDDAQVSDSICRRRDLLGEFRIESLSPILADGLDTGREFLYVRVEDAPIGGELIW